MKKFIFILFSVIVVVGVWFYSNLWLTVQAEQGQMEILQQDILDLEEENNVLLAQLVKEEAKKDQLSGTIETLNDELMEARKPEFITLVHKDPDAKRRFVSKDTFFWFLPGENQASMGTIEAGTLVRVIQETHNNMTGQDYLYVEIVNYAEPENTRGYIKKESTVYFTPDLEIQVTNPLTLPAGSVVFENTLEEEQETILAEDLTVFKVGMEDGMAILGSFGGQTIRTKESNIQYPKSSID